MGAILVKPFQYKQSKLITIITQLTAAGASKPLFIGVRNTCTLYYFFLKLNNSHIYTSEETNGKKRDPGHNIYKKGMYCTTGDKT